MTRSTTHFGFFNYYLQAHGVTSVSLFFAHKQNMGVFSDIGQTPLFSGVIFRQTATTVVIEKNPK